MKIIGIGDNVVDKYKNLGKMFPGGNALNVSVFAKKLGIFSAYLGVFGNDKAAIHIINTLNEIGVDISNSRQCEGDNAYAEVSIKDGERIFIGTNKGGVASKNPIKLTEDDISYIRDFNLIHTSCYSHIENQLKKLWKLQIPISFDFSTKTEESYLKTVCPYVTFSFLSCSHLDEKNTIELLKKVIRFGSKMAVGTRGKEGAILLYKDKIYYQNAIIVEPVDTLGAGDAFISAFLIKMLKQNFNYSEEVIKQGLIDGAKFAAKTCGINGAFGYGINF